MMMECASCELDIIGAFDHNRWTDASWVYRRRARGQLRRADDHRLARRAGVALGLLLVLGGTAVLVVATLRASRTTPGSRA